MALIYQFPTPIPVTNGNYPQFKFAVFGDNLAAITTAGYLNAASVQAGIPLSNADVIMTLYSYNPTTTTGTFGIFTVSIATNNGKITLVEWTGTSGVVLPTTANHVATYTNTTGTISEDPVNAITFGNFQAGDSTGRTGAFISYPAAGSNGYLAFTAITNGAGNFTTTITNAASVAQNQFIRVPDSGAGAANFLVAPGALVNNNLVKASGTGGVVADSGIAATSVTTFTGPTIQNHIAVFNTTSGAITDDVSTAINGGNLQAGLSGTAGTLASFPSTASRGSLVLQGVANAGNTNTIISNAAMGQASTLTIPDPGGAAGNFAVAPAPLVSGNFIKSSGTAGLVIDGGAAIHGGITPNYDGGATSHAFTVTGMSGAWFVVASNATSANSVSITKVVPSNNTLTITWSGDPGLATVVTWIALTAAI